jgi:hypothetical protein
MLSDIYDILGGVLFGMLLSSGLIEMILTAAWSKMYFTAGPPIFLLRIPVETHYSNIPPSHKLETHFHSTRWAPALAFKEIETDTYGFREKFFDFRMYAFRYSPIMHGLLIFDRNNKQVVVKGFANWSVLFFELLFLAVVIIKASFPNILLFVFLPFLFFLFIYSVQYSHFSDVARFAAEAWTRKYLKDKDFFGY